MKRKSPHILIANGVNLDLLGRRELEIYGRETLQGLQDLLASQAPHLARIAGFKGCTLSFFQTNDEAKFLNEISKKWDGAVINPGAWTHTSLALGDRLAALQLPFVEVHLSQLAKREAFRQHSYLAPHALGSVQGLGFGSYLAGLLGLLHKLALLP